MDRLLIGAALAGMTWCLAKWRRHEPSWPLALAQFLAAACLTVALMTTIERLWR